METIAENFMEVKVMSLYENIHKKRERIKKVLKNVWKERVKKVDLLQKILKMQLKLTKKMYPKQK